METVPPVPVDIPLTPAPYYKKKPVLLSIVLLIILAPLSFYIYKNYFIVQKNIQTQGNIPASTKTEPEEAKISCDELAKIRSNSRKTGAVTFVNKDNSTSSAQMFRVGGKYITPYSDTSGPDIYTRAGKVLEINETEQIITLDVGENHKMKIKPLVIRVMKNSIKFGQKVDDTYTKVERFCGLEKGDMVEFSVNKKDSKDYKSVVTANIVTLIQ